MPEKLIRRFDLDFTKWIEAQQIVVARDDVRGITVHCEGENHVVVRISAS